MNSTSQGSSSLSPNCEIGMLFRSPLLRGANFSGSIRMEDNKKWKISAEARDIRLSEIVGELLEGVNLPKELPDIELETLLFQVNSKGEYTLGGRVELEEPEKLTCGEITFPVGAMEFSFEKNSEGIACSIKTEIPGFHIADEFQCNNFSLSFEYKENEWSLGGLLDLLVFDHSMAFTAGYKQSSDGTKTLSFKALKPFPPIDLPGASFEFDAFYFEIIKKEEKTSLDLSGVFTFETELFSLEQGKVSLIETTDKSGLKLSANDIELKLIDANYYPWFTISNPELELLYTKSDKQWSCHGSTGFLAHNVPDILTRVFPVSEVETECTINSTKAEFSIRIKNEKDGLLEIPAPMDVGDFGHAYFGVNEMKIDLMNGGSLTAKLKFGLPKGLNKIFQPDPDAEDKLEIFRAYDPDKEENKEEDLLGANLIVSSDGLKFQLDQSPFKFFKFDDAADGRKIIDFDLKEFGHFSVDVPEFSLEPDGSFKASGGFDVIEEIQFPLTPFKFLLRCIKLEHIADALPDGIPVKGVNFYEGGEFRCDAFFDLFMLDGKQVPLPEWLREGFDAVDDIVNRLPNELLKYGNTEIPDHLHFNIDFSADGSLSFQLSVKDPAGHDEPVPIRFLLPTFPNFTGIELYSIAFGELLGGALLRLDLDVEIDNFDLPSLLAALLIPYANLPDEIRNILPDPKEFQNSFRAQNLMLAIIYESGIPIPIPLFYDKLGISYKGISGTEVESSFRFPKPKFKLSDFVLLFSEFKAFFSDPYKTLELDEITFGNFTVGPNYLRFPKYISTEEGDPALGKLIGTEQGFTISPVKIIGAILNTVKLLFVKKILYINELIQVVEVERRVGEIDLKIFDVLKTHYEYAFTTPFEFVSYAYKELDSFTEAQAKEFIEILPPKRTGVPEKIEGEYSYPVTPITEDTQGLIIFLKGKLNIADALKFDTGFGLVATGQGFGMGMNYDGFFTDVFNIHMKGVVAIKKEGEFLLEGESRLNILQQNILYGYFRFSNQGFKIEAKAGDGPIRLEGLLEGEFTNKIFRLEGKASLVLFSLSADGEAKFLFSKEKKLIYLHGNIEIGDFIKLEAIFETRADKEQAGMLLSMHGKISDLLELKLDGKALLHENNFQANGSAYMSVLDQEVIEATFNYLNDVLMFKGMLNLFPGNDLLEISGNIEGILAPGQFQMEGEGRVVIVGCRFGSAGVFITDKEFSIATELFSWQTLLIARKEETGFKILGTMSPITMGSAFQITAAEDADPITQYDLGGPTVYISTSPDSPGLALSGKISVLGISNSTDIRFNKDGFLLDFEGNIFNLIKSSFTIRGTDLGDSKKIFLKGTIDVGDFQQKTSKMITDTANEVTYLLGLAKNKVDDADKYLKEQEEKVKNLDKEIAKCNEKINDLKKAIEDKKKWFNNLHWTKKPWKLGELGIYVAAKGLEIAGLYAKIGLLEGAKLTALGAIEIARAAVKAVSVTISGTSIITQKLADASNAVIKAANNFLSIESADFSTSLDSILGSTMSINIKGKFLNKGFEFKDFKFNLLEPKLAVRSLMENLMKK